MENLPRALANSGAIDIKKQLESISGGIVLDVATQSGSFILTLIEFLRDYNSFTGIDISTEEWDEKRFSKYPVEFIEMNAESLQFKDSTFDTVCISHSLHHLFSIERVFTEMKRVLKPNGHFILQEMFRDGSQSDAQKSDILQHHWGAEIDRLFGVFHQQTYTKHTIGQILAKLNLREEKIIESTHYVKCLACDDKFICDNPKNKDIINYAIKEVDEDLLRLQNGLEQGILKNNSHLKRLFLEGERLKKRIKEYGSASASHLFFKGRK